MIRMLIQFGINLASAAIGLLVASLMLEDFHLQLSGFLTAVAVLTVAQTVLAPFVFTMAKRYATAMLGGIGIISTLLALWLASLVPGGITVTSFTTWFLAALVVWVCMALGGWLLLGFVLKRRAAGKQG